MWYFLTNTTIRLSKQRRAGVMTNYLISLPDRLSIVRKLFARDFQMKSMRVVIKLATPVKVNQGSIRLEFKGHLPCLQSHRILLAVFKNDIQTDLTWSFWLAWTVAGGTVVNHRHSS